VPYFIALHGGSVEATLLDPHHQTRAMAGNPITWIQVMDLVRKLDEKRRAGEHLSELDADGLVTLLLAFNEGVVCALPTSETRPERVGGERGQASER
jgi:hypothetical protein